MQGRLSLRDRPIVPALLSTPGIALPLFYLSELFYALLFPPPLPVGGEGPGIFIFLIPILIAVAAFLAIAPAIFTTFLLRQPPHHRNWGIALTIWWSLECIYLGLGVVGSLSMASALYGSSNQFSFSWWGTFQDIVPLLGLVGGVWAIVWHTGTTGTDLARRIISPPGRVLLGGLIVYFSISFIPGFMIFSAPAIGLLFSSMVLFFVPRTRRALGAVVLVGCVFVGVLLPSQIQDLGGYPVSAYYGFGAAVVALVIGTILAGSGGVGVLRKSRTLGEKEQERSQKESRNRMWELPSSGS